jgi:alpha-galactosidase/6-phospho-beta-glucosidase family protein
VTLDPAVVIAALGIIGTGVGAFVRMVYMDIRRDRDEWRDMALALRDVNKTAIGVADKAAKRG